MRPLPRPQPRRSFRLPRPRRLAVLWLGAGVVTAWFVADVAGDAEAARDRWGATTTVWVTTREVGPGRALGDGDVELADAPRALVPRDAVADDPRGRVVRSRLSAGEILVAHRLSGPGASGLAAVLDVDERAVAIPSVGFDLPVAVGDHVDVLATFDPLVGPHDGTVVLADRARVVDVEAETVTVAVTVSDARTLTNALVHATVTLALAA